MHRRNSGFTLVELSIVLVILGLLVGGVLAGQSLIRAAQLRSILTERDQYRTALNTFKDKYFALPGDMPNAVRYWGFQAGNANDGVNSTCAALTAAATGTVTCNGDGNGIIGGNVTSAAFEWTRAWQHLANAGLISGQYGGAMGSCGGWCIAPGDRTPKSKFSGAAWTFGYIGLWSGDANWFLTPETGNIFVWGSQSTTNTIMLGAVISPPELYNIDMKTDDGIPDSGKVFTFTRTAFPNCTVAEGGKNVYRLSHDGVACSIIFSMEG